MNYVHFTSDNVVKRFDAQVKTNLSVQSEECEVKGISLFSLGHI